MMWSFIKDIYTVVFHCNFLDCLGREMHRKLKEVASLDQSKFDCLAVAILTHGISGKLYSTDGDLIPVEDLTKYYDGLNCPALIGKPKVLTIIRHKNFSFEIF